MKAQSAPGTAMSGTATIQNAAVPNVAQAQRLFGDPDYLLRVITADLGAYQRLEDDVLAALPGMQRQNSTLVMKQVVQDRPLRGQPCVLAAQLTGTVSDGDAVMLDLSSPETARTGGQA